MRALAAGAVVLVAIVAVAALRLPSTQGARRAECGEERWDVKTLTDSAAGSVDVAHPKTKTVEALRRMKAPKGLKESSSRIPPVETTVYKVKALVMSMRLEKDDDIHLVIADPKIGGSMIVEFPDAACVTAASSARQADMKAAKNALAAACGPLPKSLSKVVTLQGKATITGVGFFDLIHGQGGVAQNGIELHPVLAFSSTSCAQVKP